MCGVANTGVILFSLSCIACVVWPIVELSSSPCPVSHVWCGQHWSYPLLLVLYRMYGVANSGVILFSLSCIACMVWPIVELSSSPCPVSHVWCGQHWSYPLLLVLYRLCGVANSGVILFSLSCIACVVWPTLELSSSPCPVSHVWCGQHWSYPLLLVLYRMCGVANSVGKENNAHAFWE